MRRFSIAAVAAATLLLAAGTATAARSLRFEDGRRGEGPIEVTATGSFTFPGNSELSAERQIICPVTLRSAIPRSVPKVARAEFGQVTGATVGTRAQCTTLFPVREPPIAFLEIGVRGKWLQRYEAFLGVLPNIAGIKYRATPIYIKWNWEASPGLPIECLYEGDAIWLMTVERGSITRQVATLGETRLHLVSGSLICPAEYVFQASMTLSRLTVTLV